MESKDNLWINEDFCEVNQDKDGMEHCLLYSRSDVYETFTSSVGKLFKRLQKEYGRCTGKVYVTRDGSTQAIGWVFRGKAQYEDTGRNGRAAEYYIREVWVTVHTGPPTRTVEYHYAGVGRDG